MKKILFIFMAAVMALNIFSAPVIINGTLVEWTDAAGDIVIPDEVLELGDNVFSGNKEITSVSGGAKLLVIGNSAFEGTNITSLSFPQVKIIKNKAFFNDNFSLVGVSPLKFVSLPAVTSIGDDVFFGCGITTIDFSQTTKIGKSAFLGCDSLKTVNLPQVTDIGEYAFSNCTSLTSINLPLASAIKSGTFNYCKNLTSVNLPNASYIRAEAFRQCTSLKEIHLPMVKELGYPYDTQEGVFSNCYALEKVTLPMIERIYKLVFEGCPSLKTVDCSLSKQLTGVDATAFSIANGGLTVSVANRAKIALFLPEADRQYKVVSIIPTYDINVSSMPSGRGTVTGSGNYEEGDQVEVTATALPNFGFVNWTESGTIVSTSATYTFTASANRNLEANFVPVTYSVSVSIVPETGGTVSGTGSNFKFGDQINLTASSNAHFSFSHWGEDGELVWPYNSYSFRITGNRSFTAHFKPIMYTLSVTASQGGTVTGGGSYQSGTSQTVTAIANENYQFVNWTEDGVVVSTSESYTFTMSKNRTLRANFSLVSYTVTLTPSNSEQGIVSGGGDYPSGTVITVSASPYENYYFTYWVENGYIVSHDANYTFTLKNNRQLVANFERKMYTISTIQLPGGTVSGTGSFPAGSYQTVTATPDEDYEFGWWSENCNIVSREATYSFSLTSDKEIVAHFIHDPKLVLDIAPSENGTIQVFDGNTVIPSGTVVPKGKKLRITSHPNDGYKLDYIEINDAYEVSAVFVEATTDVSQVFGNGVMKIYPNPAENNVTVQLDSYTNIQNLVIIDSTGKTIELVPVKQSRATFNVSNYTRGVYYIQAGSETQKLIVK